MPGLGDAPIEEKYRDQMRHLAEALDEFLNPDAEKGKHPVGFMLMVFPLDSHEGRCNYISNARREDVVVLLKEQLARFQGQPEVRGTA
jgi:hypothetical protein